MTDERMTFQISIVVVITNPVFVWVSALSSDLLTSNSWMILWTSLLRQKMLRLTFYFYFLVLLFTVVRAWERKLYILRVESIFSFLNKWKKDAHIFVGTEGWQSHSQCNLKIDIIKKNKLYQWWSLDNILD